MSVITDFLPGVILEDPPTASWLLDPDRALTGLRVYHVLKSVLTCNLEGSTGKGCQLKVLIKVLGRLSDAE